MSLYLATFAMAAENAAIKEAVKDSQAAAKNPIRQQVRKETASASATAAAAKAFEEVSAELYLKARQEGNLIIYSVWDVEHLKVTTEAFMKRYTGIKATYWASEVSILCSPIMLLRLFTQPAE